MKPFSEIWAFTDKIPGSFTLLSAGQLYRYALEVPAGGTIVEVGVDQGRSASILMEAAPEAAIILVDSWESVLIDNKAKVERLVEEIGRHVVTIHGHSVPSAALVTAPIDLIHIDADHYEGIAQDCETWLPKVRSGGVACFHDYGAGFPAVTLAVNKYTEGWEDLGVWDGLAIRRKR